MRTNYRNRFDAMLSHGEYAALQIADRAIRRDIIASAKMFADRYAPFYLHIEPKKYEIRILFTYYEGNHLAEDSLYGKLMFTGDLPKIRDFGKLVESDRGLVKQLERIGEFRSGKGGISIGEIEPEDIIDVLKREHIFLKLAQTVLGKD